MSRFITYVNTSKSHFLPIRTIVRELYELQSDCKLSKDLDEPLKNADVKKIRNYEKQQAVLSVIMEREESSERVEMLIYKSAFKSLCKITVQILQN